MLMRVSIGIHKDDLESAFETYDLISQQWFTHATQNPFSILERRALKCLVVSCSTLKKTASTESMTL
jgi:ribonucleotide reductase alpha subunit